VDILSRFSEILLRRGPETSCHYFSPFSLSALFLINFLIYALVLYFPSVIRAINSELSFHRETGSEKNNASESLSPQESSTNKELVLGA
jgi:hypothetical protein